MPTRRSLDALADLYLTDPPPGAGASAHAAPPDDPADDPHPRAAGEPPREEGGRAERRPYLFLHEQREARERTERPAPRLEAVVLGHLPGYASPWVSQYADEAARRHGGAALLRVAEREVTLELFRVDLAEDDREEPAAQPPAGGPEELLETLEGLAGRLGAWLVLFDEPGSGPTRRRLTDLDRWTILSGSDDAAVVGAYRLLKSLVGEGGAGRPRDGVGMMFVGCAESAARHAADRLRSAASYVMRLPVDLIGHRHRMDAVRRRHFGRFAFDRSDPWRMLNGFFGELLELGAEGRAKPSPSLVSDAEARGAATEWDGPDVRPTASRVHEPAAAEQSQPAAVAGAAPSPPPSSTRSSPEPRVVGSVDAVKPLPVDPERPGAPLHGIAPRREDSGAAGDRPPEQPEGAEARDVPLPAPDDLAAYVPGVEALAGRCPRQPEVRLAIDRSGRLHVMRKMDEAVPVDAAVRGLVEASAWAEEHRDLLRPAGSDSPRFQATESRPPVLHLFTDTPRAALDLACAGPADRRAIRLHLLKLIPTASGQPIHVHEPLN